MINPDHHYGKIEVIYFIHKIISDTKVDRGLYSRHTYLENVKYEISYESVDSCDCVFIRITTEKGLTGLGLAAPDLAVTGETVDDVYDCYTSVIEPFLKGCDVLEYAWIMESLKKSLPDNPSARAMVDMALYDIVAQKAGIPLYQMLGGYRNKITTSITIGILSTDMALAYAKEHVKRGFKVLKIKGRNLVEKGDIPKNLIQK